MNTSPTPRNLSIWLFAAILGAALMIGPASASASSDLPDLPARTVIDIDESAAPLAELEPSGVSVMSLAQCASGYFCVWTESNYLGAIQRFSNQSQYTPIVISPVRSFYNNRSKRVYIYADSSGAVGACHNAYVKKPTTSGWLRNAKGTYLSTATSC